MKIWVRFCLMVQDPASSADKAKTIVREFGMSLQDALIVGPTDLRVLGCHCGGEAALTSTTIWPAKRSFELFVTVFDDFREQNSTNRLCCLLWICFILNPAQSHWIKMTRKRKRSFINKAERRKT